MIKPERIYITKGGLHKTVDGENCFKRCGLLINKKIYWLDFYFAEYHEISQHLRQLNIDLRPNMKEFRIIEDGKVNSFSDDDAYYPVTKINKPDWQVFDPNSSYWKRTQFTDDGKRSLWGIDDIKSKHLLGV